MKDYQRQTPQFSLCGLNCALCPMHLGRYCPGCGGGEGHQPCAVIRCSQQHGNIAYCYLCGEYPCERHRELMEYDSFITHKNMINDSERAKRMGMEKYLSELDERTKHLKRLLEHYNDGRRKTFFCTAVTLLDIQDIRAVIEQIALSTKPGSSLKERAALAVGLFRTMAEQRGVVLELRKKPKKEQ